MKNTTSRRRFTVAAATAILLGAVVAVPQSASAQTYGYTFGYSSGPVYANPYYDADRARHEYWEHERRERFEAQQRYFEEQRREAWLRHERHEHEEWREHHDFDRDHDWR